MTKGQKGEKTWRLGGLCRFELCRSFMWSLGFYGLYFFIALGDALPSSDRYYIWSTILIPAVRLQLDKGKYASLLLFLFLTLVDILLYFFIKGSHRNIVKAQYWFVWVLCQCTFST